MKNSEKEKLFVSMFNENREKIFRLCNAYLTDKTEVDDLFQEIMINVWNNLEKFRGEAKISTWVYRIAINTAFLFTKKINKNKELFIKYIPQNISSDSNQMQDHQDENIQLLKHLHHSINKLEKQDRIIISLVLEGLKYSEISEVTGLSSNHIGVKINRIKSVLFKLMKEVKNG